MTSFLVKKKDNKSYEEKISSSPESTQRSKKYAINSFNHFTKEKYKMSSTEIIEEINRIRKE
ncbi:MAG: hypothetical protein OER82_00895 [Nitrosopumilus sp.]|nr:hypothetical protein [Nitrosopumilus sp.]